MSWMRTALVNLNGTTGSPTSLFKNADELSVYKTELLVTNRLSAFHWSEMAIA